MFNWISGAFIAAKKVFIGTVVAIGLIHSPPPQIATTTAQNLESAAATTTQESSAISFIENTVQKVTARPTSINTEEPAAIQQNLHVSAPVAPVTDSAPTVTPPAQFTLPNGTVVDAQGKVLKQGDIAPQVAQDRSVQDADNAWRLQQTQAAASTTKAKMDAYNAKIKADAIKDVQDQLDAVALKLLDNQKARTQNTADISACGLCNLIGVYEAKQKELKAELPDLYDQQSRLQLKLNAMMR